MAKMANEYDKGLSGKDGNLTRLTQYIDEEDTRITNYGYDWRNRRTSNSGEIDFFEGYTLDNLNRVIRTDRRNTTSSGTLVGRTERKYDTRGPDLSDPELRGKSADGRTGKCTDGQHLVRRRWQRYQAATCRSEGIHQDRVRRRESRRDKLPGAGCGRKRIRRGYQRGR
jgi:hypothetical protein